MIKKNTEIPLNFILKRKTQRNNQTDAVVGKYNGILKANDIIHAMCNYTAMYPHFYFLCL